MYHTMNIAGFERQLPLCPITDDLYIAAFVIFGDVELCGACASELLKKAPDYDILLTAESKGIPLVHDMARLNNDKTYIIARKSAKLYMQNIISVHLKSITTANVQSLFLDGNDAEKMKRKRILIVDDVISTGESISALERLVAEVGGEVVGKMAVLAEGDAIARDDIIYLENLPLFTSNGEAIDT